MAQTYALKDRIDAGLRSMRNRLEALPFDSLTVGSTSVTVSGQPYPHTRVVTITAPSSKAKQVQLVITPSNALYKPDTAKFSRTLPATTTALDQNGG